MQPLDLRKRPPRSCYAELDGLLLLPRTIDKARAQLPGGHCGEYFINGPMKGISGFLLERLGVTEAEFVEAVRTAADEEGVARWLRGRTDPAAYPSINETLRRIKPKHAEDPASFNALYAQTLAAHPELQAILDIIEADDRRIFGGS